jgi:hypothetical protein
MYMQGGDVPRLSFIIISIPLKDQDICKPKSLVWRLVVSE